MINYCQLCGEGILEGERVTFLAEGDYHQLPSKIAFAISPKTLEMDTSTLAHRRCPINTYED